MSKSFAGEIVGLRHIEIAETLFVGVQDHRNGGVSHAVAVGVEEFPALEIGNLPLDGSVGKRIDHVGHDLRSDQGDERKVAAINIPPAKYRTAHVFVGNSA